MAGQIKDRYRGAFKHSLGGPEVSMWQGRKKNVVGILLSIRRVDRRLKHGGVYKRLSSLTILA